MSGVQLNSYGQKRRIHLHRQPRTTKKRGLVEYYSLATCLFAGGKNQKKIILGIGELSKEQADQYRLMLRAINGQMSSDQIVDIESIVFGDERQYLDVLTMNALWQELGLDKVFNSERDHGQRLSTEHVARILTIGRLLHPSSKVRSVEWFANTLLASIMDVDQDAYDRNKIFRELAAIHGTKARLERLFWDHSQRERRKYDAYYFDGSTTWFEGAKCLLAEADIEKTRGHFPKVIGLMLITDNDGFPVAWEVVNGHSKDTTQLKAFVDRISNEFGIQEITYCFDRGVASDNNFALITSVKSKYISAIRDNQIKKVFDLKKFVATRLKITERVCGNEEAAGDSADSRPQRRIVDIDGFCSLDENIFYKDLGILDGRRYVASFNYELFIKEHHERNERIDRALKEIAEKNTALKAAKGDRDYNATERDLLDLLGKHRVRNYFDYKLLPLTSEEKAQSFKIEIEIKREKITHDELTDGLLIYITDHVEKSNAVNFVVSAADIVLHYKGKHVVENAFRELKSFIELRPLYVWTEAHVKAHYDISIIACYINNYINVKLKQSERSLRDFHAHFAKAGRVAQLLAPSGLNIFKLKKVNEETKRYLKRLGIDHILSPQVQRAHGVCQ